MTVVLAIGDRHFQWLIPKNREYAVLTADDPEAGLKIARRKHPDAILIDYGMQGMADFEPVRRLRQGKRTATIPIGVIGVWSDVYEDALQAGADAALPKAFLSNDVIEMVESLLAHRPFAPEPVPSMAVILWIEDEPALLEMGRMILEHRGYIAITTTNPLEGLEIVLREHPNVILTDDVLPEIWGDELVRRLRQDQQTSSTPIAVVGTLSLVIERAMQAGADAAMSKPFTPDALHQLVESLLAMGQERKSSE